MRPRVALLGVLVLIAIPATASADVAHVVTRGETLTSIAKTDGLSVAALAAANHLSATSELTIGQILMIPPQRQTVVAAATTTHTPVAAVAPVASQRVAPVRLRGSGPQPTDERVSASEIAQIADSEGVPAALAEAIAWQESGWNNDEVSAAGAVGVMQIVPVTWNWIDKYLTPTNPLQPASAAENVRAGVLALRDLLTLTGGSYAMTAAAYYQGLASIQAHGLYRETKRYVADVLALTARFGG